MFKKLKQKIAEESEGEQSPLRQQSREGQVQKIYLVIRVNASLVKGQIVLSSMSCVATLFMLVSLFNWLIF